MIIIIVEMCIYSKTSMSSHYNSNWHHNIYLYEEVDKTYIGCNLKTMESLDCALIGVCAVIRLNIVYIQNVLYLFMFEVVGLQ